MKRIRFTAQSTLPHSAAELWTWHTQPGALERLIPPWDAVHVEERPTSGLVDGSRLVLRVGIGPFARRWVARHEGFEPGRAFRDVQESGPFAAWAHDHRFLPQANGSMLEDAIEYALPGGALGRALVGRIIGNKLQRTFARRHAVTRGDLERHAAGQASAARTIAVSGSSGLVGSALVAFLRTGGHRVVRLVRREPQHGADELLFDPAGGRIDAEALSGLDAVVHLAGENIAGARWTSSKKRRIRDSRVHGTTLLAEAMAGLRRPPQALVSASAIGWYGDRGDEELDETSSAGAGFLADTCRAWEAATVAAERAGVRVVRVRVGVVLAAGGGALRSMLPLFLLGAGGRVGSGRQWMSWIAHDDLIGVLHRAIVDARLDGALNAVAPQPVRNSDFTRTLGRVLRRPAILPAPAPAIRLILGEMGQALLLAGARVFPRNLERVGFAWRHAELEAALRFELGRGFVEQSGVRFSGDR